MKKRIPTVCATKILSILTLFSLAMFFLSVPGFAQGVPNQVDAPETAQNEVDPSTLGPKNAAFYEAHKPMVEKIQRLHTLTLEYQSAKPERRDAIIKEYEPLSIETEKASFALVTLATEAFQETPYKNPDVVMFLLQMANYAYGNENYESAFRIYDLLLTPEMPQELSVFYGPAGESAFCIMELDKAEQWIAKAKELPVNTYDKESVGRMRQYESLIPQFRKDWAEEKAIREKEEANNLPRVLIKTSKGDIELVLFEDEAPNSVANFISLVEKGFYNNTPFHRVLPFFMAQGGDPTGTGSGGPGYAIDCECNAKSGKPTPRKHFRGSISMANAGPNTNGSQFFLTFVPTSFLDGRHTVFGRVAKGMDILGEIQRIDPEDQNAAIQPDRILEAKVLSKRNHPYEPVKNDKRR